MFLQTLIRDLFKLGFKGENATTVLLFLQDSSQICLSLILMVKELQQYYCFCNNHHRFLYFWFERLKLYYNVSVFATFFTELFQLDFNVENATTILMFFLNTDHRLV